MASDPVTSARVAAAIEGRGFEHRIFFGGDAWFYQNNFALGVKDDTLVARLGPDAAAAVIEEGLARPMDITGRPMRGWVYIAPQHHETDTLLGEWIDQVSDFVQTLPAKPSKPKKHK